MRIIGIKLWPLTLRSLVTEIGAGAIDISAVNLSLPYYPIIHFKPSYCLKPGILSEPGVKR
jgi:hypothetical protein